MPYVPTMDTAARVRSNIPSIQPRGSVLRTAGGLGPAQPQGVRRPGNGAAGVQAITRGTALCGRSSPMPHPVSTRVWALPGAGT